MLRRKTQAADPPQPTTDTPRPATETPTETAVRMRAEAAQRRSDAHQVRIEAETLVTTARKQAARLVQESEQQARKLAGEAQTADRQAKDLEETAQAWAAVADLGEQAQRADEQAATLAAEADDLAARDTALARSLGDLAAEREDTAARLAAAREACDVDRVTELRARLAAVDEVAAVLDGQRTPLRARLEAIGAPDGSGELAVAHQAARRARTAQRRLLNRLDPTRIEALVDEFQACLMAQLDAVGTPDPGPQQPRTQVLRTPGGGAAALVRG